MDTKEKVRENKARRQAWRQGLIIRKSRSRTWNCDDLGGYMIINAYGNYIEAGVRFDLSLVEVEEYLKED